MYQKSNSANYVHLNRRFEYEIQRHIVRHMVLYYHLNAKLYIEIKYTLAIVSRTLCG